MSRTSSTPPAFSALPFSAASERNREPILDLLRPVLASTRHVLEIGSGTGQHAVYFARELPHLVWQPSDRSDWLEGLRQRIANEGGSNVREPLELDVMREPWPLSHADAVYSANTLHIMSWLEVEALFRGAGTLLGEHGLVAIYGPFRYAGRYTSESNADFDAQLRLRDPRSGIRDFGEVDALARDQGLSCIADHRMPANNQLIIWVR